MAKQHPNSAKNLKPPIKKGEVRNPYGRPKKLTSHIISGLRKAGFDNVKTSQVADIMELLLNVPENILSAMSNDKDNPSIVSIVSREMIDKKNAWTVVNTMLDRAHGKALARIETESNLKIENDLNNLSTEELLKIRDGLD